MKIHTIGALLAGCLLAAGCASIPEARPEVPAGKVAATNEQAAGFLSRYDEVNNAANVDRDTDAIATVETGPLLETSLTSYELAEANAAEPPSPYYHTDVAAYSPRFTEYPMWFVATSRINSDPNRIAVLTVSRESAADEWLVEQGGALGAAELPEIRVEAGGTSEVPGAQAGRVARALDNVNGYLAGGEEPIGVDVSADGLATFRDWTQNSTIQLEEVTEPEVTCQTDEQSEVRMLPTTDGVLGIATARCVIRQSLRDDVPGEMTLGGELSALAPEAGRSVEFVSSHPLVVHVPEDGDAVVHAGSWRWADVTMSQ